jgi:hypothetical protein
MTKNQNNGMFSKRRLGLGLAVLSFIFYGIIFLMPFAPLDTTNKIILSVSLAILGEASFWVAAFILGKRFISRSNIIKNFKNLLYDLWITKKRNSSTIEKKWQKKTDDSEKV